MRTACTLRGFRRKDGTSSPPSLWGHIAGSHRRDSSVRRPLWGVRREGSPKRRSRVLVWGALALWVKGTPSPQRSLLASEPAGRRGCARLGRRGGHRLHGPADRLHGHLPGPPSTSLWVGLWVRHACHRTCTRFSLSPLKETTEQAPLVAVLR